MGLSKSPNGAGQIHAGRQQVLASLLRAISASEALKETMSASQGATRP
jgi:hypothetical protein